MGTRDFEFESAPELPGADRVSKIIMGGLRRLSHRMWDFEVEGRDNIPTDGPAIITPNHLSFCDSVFVPSALPRRVWAIGKGEYMDSWKTKHIFPALGMIPIDRSGGDAAQAALDTAASVLDTGHLFMIYPEGTRSRSGNLHKGRTGAARLAIRCNAPIVPVGHEGTVAVQEPDTVVMKPFRRVTVRFGEPMWAHEYGDLDDPRTLRRFTDAVMFEISQLSGQAYVDEYAGSKTAVEPVTTPDVGTADTEEHAAPAPRSPASRPARIKRPLRRPASIGVESETSDGDTEQQWMTPRRPSIVGSGPAKIPTPQSRALIRPPSGHSPAPTSPDPSGPIKVSRDQRDPAAVAGR